MLIAAGCHLNDSFERVSTSSSQESFMYICQPTYHILFCKAINTHNEELVRYVLQKGEVCKRANSLI